MYTFGPKKRDRGSSRIGQSTLILRKRVPERNWQLTVEREGVSAAGFKFVLRDYNLCPYHCADTCFSGPKGERGRSCCAGAKQLNHLWMMRVLPSRFLVAWCSKKLSDFCDPPLPSPFPRKNSIKEADGEILGTRLRIFFWCGNTESALSHGGGGEGQNQVQNETASERRPVSFASLSSHTICRRRRQKSAFFLDPSLSFALYARAQSKKKLKLMSGALRPCNFFWEHESFLEAANSQSMHTVHRAHTHERLAQNT